MNDQHIAAEPKLAEPGAGLPPLEWAMAKFVIFPVLFATAEKQNSIAAFSLQSQKIESLCDNLNSKELSARRLIPRIRGLEDSSRNWSVAMTLQHLVIVGNLMRQVIVDLSHGGTTMESVAIPQVKPGLNVDPAAVLKDFKDMTQRFVEETTAAPIDKFPKATFNHPWFGALNAKQWLVFAAPHQAIHRKQIKNIISML